jgi:phosphinothricin acetyltransferase
VADPAAARPRPTGLSVRAATPGDAAAVARIYNQGIADRIATFETEPRSAEHVADLLRERAGSHPAVVAVAATGEVVGFAWTAPYGARPCYAGVGEFSVYVARERRGMGVGLQLLDGLAGACRARGFWKLVSRVFPENTASLRLCARAGYREVGTYRRHARLDGAWRDTVIVEKLLADDEAASGGAAPVES